MDIVAVHTTVSAASIAAVVDRRYGIGRVSGCRLLQIGFNDTYELEGADGRTYFVRLSNHRFRGPPNIGYETALLAHLDRSGIVVGVPVADTEGNLWQTVDAPEGPRELVVFEPLSGRRPLAALNRTGTADERTLADIGALGASLAAIHTAGETFGGPPSLYRLEATDLLESPLAQIAAAFDGELAEQAGTMGDGLRTRLAACAPSLSLGHAHGDNHAGNTLVADAADGTPVAGWFDFDDGGPGFLAYDLATFLWSFLLRARSDQVGEERRPLWSAFIRGYRSVRQISAADFDAIGLLVSVRHVWLMGNYAGRLGLTGVGVISADWFREGFGLVRKWDGLAAPAVD